MNQERLAEVLGYLENYNGEESPDYYQMFGLDANANLDQINQSISNKRLRVLFHPDQIQFIPPEYQEKYHKVSSELTNAMNIFSSQKQREQYDQEIIERKVEQEQVLEAVTENTKKYGFEFTNRALRSAMNNQNYQGFTREAGTRDKMRNLGSERIKRAVKSGSRYQEEIINLDNMTMDYFYQIIVKNQEFLEKLQAFQQACLGTFLEYDMLGYSGQTKGALEQYIQSGNARAFTNKHQERTNLMEKVTPEEVAFFVSCLLNQQRANNQEYAYSNTKQNPSSNSFLYAELLFKTVEYNSHNEKENLNNKAI